MAHVLLRFLKVKPLDNEVFLLEDNFAPFSGSDMSHIRPELDKIDAEYNMTSASAHTKIEDLPFNSQKRPLYTLMTKK